MVSFAAKSLPVLIYHYTNNSGTPLTMPVNVFEEHCRILAENGWHGICLEEAEAFFLGEGPLPPKSVLISFDDGYLDNYVYAWPILRKYGHKGVIFPVADVVTATSELQGELLRPTLDDVWNGRVSEQELPPVDTPIRKHCLGYDMRQDFFISWAEARVMEQSGVISLGGHSLRHEAVYVSSAYTNYFQPGSVTAPFNHAVRDVCWGMPMFERAAELTSRAFVPSSEMISAIRALVPQDDKGAAAFFSNPQNVAVLEKLVASFGSDMGKYENEEEKYNRIFGIMRANQDILTRNLGHSVKSFCWPWGIKDPVSIKAGQEAGFTVFYNVRPGPNSAGNPASVNRFNAKLKAEKVLNRVRIYSRPWLGEIYRRCRI